jgi:hypothetical protein
MRLATLVKALLFQIRFNFKSRSPHGDAQRFGFAVGGDDTAVVITQHYHRLSPEIRTENLLATGIEAIYIDESVHGGWEGWEGWGCEG